MGLQEAGYRKPREAPRSPRSPQDAPKCPRRVQQMLAGVHSASPPDPEVQWWQVQGESFGEATDVPPRPHIGGSIRESKR